MSYPPSLSRRHLLQGFAAVAASSVLSGCGASRFTTLSSSNSKLTTPRPSPTLPAPFFPTPAAPPAPTAPPAPVTPAPTPQPLPIGAITAASLTVTGTTAGTLGPGFLGLAYQKQTLSTPLFTGSNAELIGLFKRLGTGVLRLGGTSVDQTVWTPQGPGQTSGQIAPSDVAALASFLRATGWTCIYGINLGGSATGATTSALAAAEVAYVSQQLGSSLIAVELGNECETYGDPSSFYPYAWTLQQFESLWLQYRDAIVAATPSAPLAGPAAASSVYSWTLPFGEYVTRSQIDLLTQHYNRDSATSATPGDLLSPDPALATLLQQLTYGAQSIDVPFRLTGCTSSADGGTPGVTNAFASSLWAIDTVFSAALGGASGLNFNAGNNPGNNPGNNAIDTPIADTLGTVTAVQPLYYGLLLAALAGQGSLLSTQLAASSLNVTSYALRNADGGFSLIVVNKDATQNLDLSITLPAAMTSATLQALTQLSPGATTPSLTALSGVTLQGASVALDGTFTPNTAYDLTVTGEQLSCYVPTLSAVLIQLS